MNGNLQHIFFIRKHLDLESSEPIFVMLLFFPRKEQLPLTDLEKLGLWAARKAREESKKNEDTSKL